MIFFCLCRQWWLMSSNFSFFSSELSPSHNTHLVELKNIFFPIHSSPCDPNFTFKVTIALHDKIQWKMWKKWMKFRNRLAPFVARFVSMSSRFFFRFGRASEGERLMHEREQWPFYSQLATLESPPWTSLVKVISHENLLNVYTLYVFPSLGSTLFFFSFKPPNPIISFRPSACVSQAVCECMY